MVFHPAWYCPLRKGGWGWWGSGLLKRQNSLNVTEVICRRSLITFDVSLKEKTKLFSMVISTWWLIVFPYQNILITRSKALRITTERKYLSVFFDLREAEKVDQKKIFENTLKVAQRRKAKQKLRGENGAQDEWDFLSVRYFLHAIFPVFKVFQKIPPPYWN